MTSLPTSSWNPLPASCMPATSTVPLPAPASAAPCAEGALPHTVRSASPTPTEGGKCREFMQPFHPQFLSNDCMVWKDMCVHTHTPVPCFLIGQHRCWPLFVFRATPQDWVMLYPLPGGIWLGLTLDYLLGSPHLPPHSNSGSSEIVPSPSLSYEFYLRVSY